MSKIDDYGFTDFNIIREGSSEYSLEDGTIVRLRAFILKAIKDDSDLRLNERTFAASFSPPSMKGNFIPGIPLEDAVKKVKKENLNYETVSEEWNEYKLSSGEVIAVKAILVGVSLTEIYDENGDPIYGVQIQTIHKITKPTMK